MGRAKWTDERLDDRFDILDRDIRDLRGEVRELRGEMSDGFKELRVLIYRMGGGFLVTIVVAVLLRGI